MPPGRDRKAYLDALGIESWALRLARPDTGLPAAAPEEAAGAAVPALAVAAAPVAGARASVVPPESDVPMPSPLKPAIPFDAPATWELLQPAVENCERCKLCKTRTKAVFGVGTRSTRLLVVGEGPGADEDAQGEPFVGRAGKLLDEMLRAIGRSRREPAPAHSVYIANVVKCRPPGNRDPEPEEVEACRPYLDRQIELIAPTLIVALGRVAAQRLLATDQPLSKLRGQLHEYGPRRTPVLVTYHPAYLLRSPGEKAKSWVDLKRVHQFLVAAG